MHLHATLHCSAGTGATAHVAEGPVSITQWQQLNAALRDNGFVGVPLPHQQQLQQQQQNESVAAPSPAALYTAVSSVLKQYDRRAQLVQELLKATDLARERESAVDAAMRRLRRSGLGCTLILCSVAVCCILHIVCRPCGQACIVCMYRFRWCVGCCAVAVTCGHGD